MFQTLHLPLSFFTLSFPFSFLLSPSLPLPFFLFPYVFFFLLPALSLSFPSFSFFPLLPFQLRVHVTVDSIFYLHVTSRAIIEDCSRVKFAPYAWTYPGIQDHFKVQENSHAPSGGISAYLQCQQLTPEPRTHKNGS